MTILDKILITKKEEVALEKKAMCLSEIKDKELFHRQCYSPRANIEKRETSLICEFKRRSPSKGNINLGADIAEILETYQENGAACVSVLTDTQYFGGTKEDILFARKLLSMPILRKDFIVDEYQIYQSKALGADMILLIASALSVQQCCDYADIAKALGLEVLLELHDETELAHTRADVDLVGVNNRNLKTFNCSLENSLKLADFIDEKFIRVSESSIKTAEDIRILKEKNFKAFLVGETLMKSGNIAKEMKTLMEA
ncbi:MAG: indole-3-glycerol phosphate synthase TrpC [Opitutales bacterium]